MTKYLASRVLHGVGYPLKRIGWLGLIYLLFVLCVPASHAAPSGANGTLNAWVSYPLMLDTNASLDPWLELYFETPEMNKGSVKPTVYLSTDSTKKTNLLSGDVNWSHVDDKTSGTTKTFHVFRQAIRAAGDTSLSPETKYIVSLAPSAADMTGNTLAKAIATNFTTRPETDPTVKVGQVSPYEGAMNVPAGTTALKLSLNVPFTAPVDSGYVWHAYKTWDTSKTWIGVSNVTLADNNQTTVFTAPSGLEAGTSYTLEFHCDPTYIAVSGAVCEQTYYTYRFSTAPSSESTKPEVIKGYPGVNPTGEDATTNIGGYTPVKLWFTHRMDPLSVEKAFRLANSAGKALATTAMWSSDGKLVSFTANTLMASEKHTYTLGTGARAEGASGGYLGSTYTNSFSVVASSGSSLSVVSTSPANGATNVSVGSPIVLTFNQVVTKASVEAALKISPALSDASVTLSGDGKTATITHPTALKGKTTYQISVDRAAQSTTAVNLSAPYTFGFTTGATSYPSVLSTTPSDGTTGLNPANTWVSLTFSEAMDKALTEKATQLLAGITPVCVSYTWTDNALTLTPLSQNTDGSCSTTTAALMTGMNYTLSVSTDARSAIGVTMQQAFNAHFTTSTPNIDPLKEAGYVTQTFPPNGAGVIGIETSVFIQFSEAMNKKEGGLKLRIDGLEVTGQGTWSTYKTAAGVYDLYRFTPGGALGKGKTYTAEFEGQDLSRKVVKHSLTFTTTTTEGAAPTLLTPSADVNLTIPANQPSLSFIFDQSMYASSAVYEATIEPAVRGMRVSGTGSKVTLDWEAGALTSGTTYTVSLGKSIQTSTGINIAPITRSFSVGTATQAAPKVVSITYTNTNTMTPILVQFDVGMDRDSVANAFSLSWVDANGTRTTVPVTAQWMGGTNDSVAVNFTPTQALVNNTFYDATVSVAAKSYDGGINLASAYSQQVRVDTGLYLKATTPTDGSTEVRTTQDIALVFDTDALDLESVNDNSFKLYPEGKPQEAVKGNFFFNSKYYDTPNVVFVTDQPLSDSTKYLLSLSETTAIKDKQGHVLPAQTLSFVTEMRPAVTSIFPASQTAWVPLDETIRVAFNTLVDHASAEAAFSLKTNGVTVTGQSSWFDNAAEKTSTLTFTPNAALNPTPTNQADPSKWTAYTINLAAGIKSQTSTQTSTQSFSSTFTTAEPEAEWSDEDTDAAIQAVDLVYNQMINGSIAWEQGLATILALKDADGVPYVGTTSSDEDGNIYTTFRSGEPFDLWNTPPALTLSESSTAKQTADPKKPPQNKSVTYTPPVSVSAKTAEDSRADLDDGYALVRPKLMTLSAGILGDESTMDTSANLVNDINNIVNEQKWLTEPPLNFLMTISTFYDSSMTAVNDVSVLLVAAHGRSSEDGRYRFMLNDGYSLTQDIANKMKFPKFKSYFNKIAATQLFDDGLMITSTQYVLNQKGIDALLAPRLHARAIIFLSENLKGGIPFVTTKPNAIVIATQGYNYPNTYEKRWDPTIVTADGNEIPNANGLYRLMFNTFLGTPRVVNDITSSNVVSRYLDVNPQLEPVEQWNQGVRPFTLSTIRSFVENAHWNQPKCMKDSPNEAACFAFGGMYFQIYDGSAEYTPAQDGIHVKYFGGHTLLRPSLAAAEVMSGQLVNDDPTTFGNYIFISGNFGTLELDKVKVYWNDQEISVITDIPDNYSSLYEKKTRLWTAAQAPPEDQQRWSEWEHYNGHPYDTLLAKLPAGACGGQLKVVTDRTSLTDGTASNTYPITCYGGAFDLTRTQIPVPPAGWTGSGSFEQTVTCFVSLWGSIVGHRGDIDVPAEAIKTTDQAAALVPAAVDESFCDFKYSGTVTQKTTGPWNNRGTKTTAVTKTASGSGRIPFAAANVETPAQYVEYVGNYTAPSHARFGLSVKLDTDVNYQKLAWGVDGLNGFDLYQAPDKAMTGKLDTEETTTYSDASIPSTSLSTTSELPAWDVRWPYTLEDQRITYYGILPAGKYNQTFLQDPDISVRFTISNFEAEGSIDNVPDTLTPR